MECSRCGRCCHSAVELSDFDLKKLEKRNLLGFTETFEDRDILHTVIKRKIDSNLSFDESLKTKAPCIFLDEGGCKIYDIRPLVCEIYPVTIRFPDMRLSLDKNCPMTENLKKDFILKKKPLFELHLAELYSNKKRWRGYLRYSSWSMIENGKEKAEKIAKNAYKKYINSRSPL
ncbi:MAG: YkgJ family cysteine cluster protein [Candidatus Syntropharchaeia archaeon]